MDSSPLKKQKQEQAPRTPQQKTNSMKAPALKGKAKKVVVVNHHIHPIKKVIDWEREMKEAIDEQRATNTLERWPNPSVYLLSNNSGRGCTHYTGSTTRNVDARLLDHNSGRGCKTTKAGAPDWELKGIITGFASKIAAERFEKLLKTRATAAGTQSKLDYAKRVIAKSAYSKGPLIVVGGHDSPITIAKAISINKSLGRDYQI
jgi:predicted GIY-YIG superfamily endonuclease